VVEARLINATPEYTLRDRRSADVAHADKQYFNRSFQES
jgi:hypothetical protein